MGCVLSKWTVSIRSEMLFNALGMSVGGVYFVSILIEFHGCFYVIHKHLAWNQAQQGAFHIRSLKAHHTEFAGQIHLKLVVIMWT